VAALVTALVLVTLTAAWVARSRDDHPAPVGPPPPAAGYLPLEPVGSFPLLPDDAQAAAMVHRSPWEPRPGNTGYNRTVPTGLALVPRAVAERAYDPRWNEYVLGRITGNFTGTTDEIFQWAAAKWGVPDNVLRAVAMMESTWRQSNFGDYVDDPSECPVPGTRLPCAVTYGIVGVRSSSWPGIYPWNRNSTAAAVDVLGGWLRGCYEGWVWWLRDHGNHSRGVYAAGDLWGCVGAWFSGNWHDGRVGVQSGEDYLARAQRFSANRPWLDPDF
jgi:autotransporter family porin